MNNFFVDANNLDLKISQFLQLKEEIINNASKLFDDFYHEVILCNIFTLHSEDEHFEKYSRLNNIINNIRDEQPIRNKTHLLNIFNTTSSINKAYCDCKNQNIQKIIYTLETDQNDNHNDYHFNSLILNDGTIINSNNIEKNNELKLNSLEIILDTTLHDFNGLFAFCSVNKLYDYKKCIFTVPIDESFFNDYKMSQLNSINLKIMHKDFLDGILLQGNKKSKFKI